MNYSSSSMFYAPPLTKINKSILIISVGLFILQSLCGLFLGHDPITALFALRYSSFMQGHIYTLLTYPWIADGLMSLIFNGLLIWFIGADLESSFGSKRYLALIFTSIIAAGLAYLAFQSSAPFIGLNGLCLALIICYGLLFSERMLAFMMIFPMKAKYFSWLLLAIEVYMGLFSSSGKSSMGHLAAMLVGYLFYKFTFGGGWTWGNWLKLKKDKSRKNHLHLVNRDLAPDEDERERDELANKSNISKDNEKLGPRYWQ